MKTNNLNNQKVPNEVKYFLGKEPINVAVMALSLIFGSAHEYICDNSKILNPYDGTTTLVFGYETKEQKLGCKNAANAVVSSAKRLMALIPQLQTPKLNKVQREYVKELTRVLKQFTLPGVLYGYEEMGKMEI